MTKYATTYGGALYDLAKEENLTDRILQDLTLVINVVKNYPRYLKILSSPAIPREERAAMVDEAWGGTLHPYTINFLKLIGESGHVYDFLDCKRAYHERYDEDHGITWVRAICASQPTDAQCDRLFQVLKEKLGNDRIKLTVSVDTKLIGGMKLIMNGVQYDGSMDFHFAQVRKQFKNI